MRRACLLIGASLGPLLPPLLPPLLSPAILAAPLAPLDPLAVEEAPVVEAPIREVVVLSDRAVVRRVGEARPSPRGAAVRLPDLPLSARHIRVSSPRAAVTRVETRRVTRLAAPLADLARAAEALEALRAERARLEARRAAPAAELGWLRALSPLPAAEAPRPGAAPLALSAAALSSWRETRALSQGRQARAQEALDALSDAVAALDARLAAAVAETQALLSRAEAREVLEVVVSLSGAAEPAPFTLEYTTPDARWRPRYELHFDLKRSAARRVMLAEVSQQSGEDWPRALLRFSTAAPPEPHPRPRLMTWALGEAKDLLPAPRPAEPLARPPRNPPPAEQRAAGAEGAAAVTRAVGRLRAALDAAQGDVARGEGARQEEGRSEGAHVGGSGLLGGAEEVYRAPYPSAAPPPPPPRPAPGRPQPPPMAPRAASKRALAPSMAASAPPLESSLESSRDSSPAPSLARDEGSYPAALSGAPGGRRAPSSSGGLTFEGEVAVAAPPPQDPQSPAALADGEEYLFEAPTPSSLLGDGAPILVPISAEESPVALSYEATPALAPHAYLQGALTYKGARPLLGGAGALFSGGDYVGEVTLETVRDGGVFTAPLGADTDVRLERRVELKSVVEGFFKAEEVTLYTTTLQAGNYKRRPVRLRVWDVVPVSDREEVKVEYLGATPEGTRAEDGGGVISWDLDLKPGEVKRVVMKYQLRRPKGWRLTQR